MLEKDIDVSVVLIANVFRTGVKAVSFDASNNGMRNHSLVFPDQRSSKYFDSIHGLRSGARHNTLRSKASCVVLIEVLTPCVLIQ